MVKGGPGWELLAWALHSNGLTNQDNEPELGAKMEPKILGIHIVKKISDLESMEDSDYNRAENRIYQHSIFRKALDWDPKHGALVSAKPLDNCVVWTIHSLSRPQFNL